MLKFLHAAMLLWCCALYTTSHAQIAPNLGEGARYILFSQIGAISNTGTSSITGDLGNNVGAVTGFGPPTAHNGTIQNANTSTWQAEYDISLALRQLSVQAPTLLLPNGIGGGDTLINGVYKISGACGIAGNLILDGRGDTSAVFIFQISGALTSGDASKIILINGAQAGYVFWAVTGAVTLGAGSSFAGTIISKGAISCGAACFLKGRALATVGAVSLNTTVGAVPNGPFISTVQPGCTVATGSITINAPSGPGFTYSIGGAFQSAPAFNNLPPGSYSITVKDATGIVVSAGVSSVIHPQFPAPLPYSLGTAGAFVMYTATGAVSNTSTSYVGGGNIGTNLGAVSGYSAPTIVLGNIYNADSVTIKAKTDLDSAYLALKNVVPTLLFPAAPGNGEVYTPGVYNIPGACAFAGNLILDGQGDANAIFIFQIGGAFTSGAGAAIILTNGANANRVFWVVSGAAAFGAQTTFAGTVINNAAISFGDGSILSGRALSTVGAVSIYGTLVNAPFNCYRAIEPPPGFSVHIKVLLQGPLLGNASGSVSTMRDNLRNSPFSNLNYLPAANPYSRPEYTSKFTQVGDGLNIIYQRVSDSAAMFADKGLASLVDWVFIEIRDKNNPATVVSTRAALLQRDGTVIDINGSTCILFPTVLSNDYYVAVRHRNHLGAMTASPLPASTFTCASALVVDFTTMTNADLWNNPGYDGFEMATLSDGKRALWAGNANGDRQVKYVAPNDDPQRTRSNVLSIGDNTSLDQAYDFGFGYFAGDIDLNSKAKYVAPLDDRQRVRTLVLSYMLNSMLDPAYDFFLEQLPF